MKALVLEEYNRFAFREVETPQIGADEVLVQVKACSICGSDVHGMDGSTGRRIPPIIMGHEASGVIVRWSHPHPCRSATLGPLPPIVSYQIPVFMISAFMPLPSRPHAASLPSSGSSVPCPGPFVPAFRFFRPLSRALRSRLQFSSVPSATRQINRHFAPLS